MKTLILLFSSFLITLLSFGQVSQNLIIGVYLHRDYDDSTASIIQLDLQSENGLTQQSFTTLPDSTVVFQNIDTGKYSLTVYCKDYSTKYITGILIKENENVNFNIYLDKICPYKNEAIDTITYYDGTDYYFISPTIMFKDLSYTEYDSYFNYRLDYVGYIEVTPWFHIGGSLTPYNFYSISKNDSIISPQTTNAFKKQNIFVGAFDITINTRLRTNAKKNRPTNFYIDFGTGLSLPYYSRSKFSTETNKIKEYETTKLKTKAYAYSTLEVGISFVNIRFQYNYGDILKPNKDISQLPSYTVGLGFDFGGWFFRRTSY